MHRICRLLHLIAAALGLLSVMSAAHAQAPHRMDTASRIQSGLLENEALLYRLKPATAVRPLPPAADSEAARRLTGQGAAYVRNAVSALLLDNGQLVFEHYSQGGAANVPHNAYSMTKTLTSLAVGEALCAGKIKSLDDEARTYVPALDGTPYGAATIRQLLTYTSGAKDPGGDGYGGIHSRSDFGSMVGHKISLVELIKMHSGTSRFKPGEKFIYNGLDSQTLSLVVRQATGTPLPQWFESTVWAAAGAEHPAAWFVDKEGNGIAEILFFGTSRDLARVGQYMLDRLTGVAGNACIQAYLQEAIKPLVPKGYWNGPGAPWWGFGVHTAGDGTFWMSGFNGQRVGVSVARKRVFVTTASVNSPDTDRQVTQFLVD